MALGISSYERPLKVLPLARCWLTSLCARLRKTSNNTVNFRGITGGTSTVMPDRATAGQFLDTLNSAHPSLKITMEVEREGSLPFLGTELLNRAPEIESKVYIKRTNTGLLLHFQSHVDIKYKRSLVKNMENRAYRLSSNWSFFSEECDRLRGVFHNLKYPKPPVETTIKRFVERRISSQEPCPSPDVPSETVRLVLPFKPRTSRQLIMLTTTEQSKLEVERDCPTSVCKPYARATT